MNFIKIIEPCIAKELSKHGFNYTTEKLNANTDVFCFHDCPEIREYLATNYDSKSFMISNKLFF